MLTWAQIAIGILHSGIAHERQPEDMLERDVRQHEDMLEQCCVFYTYRQCRFPVYVVTCNNQYILVCSGLHHVIVSKQSVI